MPIESIRSMSRKLKNTELNEDSIPLF